MMGLSTPKTERVGVSTPDLLVLTSAENGGWVMQEGRGIMGTGHTLGAYTNTRDMLDALEEFLLGPSPEVAHIKAEQGGAA